MNINDGRDWIIAVTIATEVPPPGTSELTDDEISIARAAVCDVIRNRVTSPDFPDDAVLVVLQYKQFSAVGTQDYWRKAMAGLWFKDHVLACLDEWRRVRAVSVDATYYYSPITMIPQFSAPRWASSKKEVVVQHLNPKYYRFFE